MIKRFFKKKTLFDILLIFILSLTPLLWFRSGEIMVGHDNVFPLDPKAFLRGRLYTWNQNQAFGRDQPLIMGSIPIYLIDALPYLLGFSLQATQKLIYILWFFLIGFSVYCLASLINPQSRFFKLFVVVFYQFNFFVLQGWWIAERTKFSALIAMPLVLSVLLLVYRQRLSIFKGAIANSLTLFFFNAGGLLGIPLFGGLFVSVGLFIIFFSLVSFYQKKYLVTRNLILVAFLTALGVFMINSYYLFPALNQLLSHYTLQLGSIGDISGVLAWAKEISAGASFANLFRLQGIAEWYDNPQHPYAKYFFTNPILVLISFIFPLLIFSSLVLVKKKEKFKFVLYFFLVYLMGIFFTAGTHPPLGIIYRLFVQFIPGFAIFRTPYFKFAPALFLSSAFLCAFTLDWLKEKIGEKKILVFLFCLSCFILIFGYHFPYFSGNFFNWRDNFSTRLKVPQYIFDFGDWLEKEKKDDYRILLLPPDSPEWQYDIYKWGYLSLEPLGWLFSRQPLLINSNTLGGEEQLLLRAAYNALFTREKELFERLAFLLRIKYLVVRKDIFYDLEWGKTESPFLYQKAIREFNYPQIKEFGEWEVYQIDSTPAEKFFVFSQPDFLDSPQEQIADYLRLNPKKENQFILSKDGEYLTVPEEGWNRFIIPRCLNCRHEKKPDINFPESKILPDSPFYPLLLLREKRGLKGGDVKARLYDYIGLSLKRTSEIRELFLKRKQFKSEYLDGYFAILEKIGREYDQIQEFEKKFQIAEDLNYYLEAQNGYFLQTFLENRKIGEREAEEMKKVFLAIHSLREKINPFLFKEERSNNRLYSFHIDTPRTFELLLKQESIQGVIGERLAVSFKLDDYLEKMIEFEPEELKNDYLSLGKLGIQGGQHHLLMALPPLPNLAEEFIFIKDSFWGKPMKCFNSKIKGFDNRKVYKISLAYKNDFSDDFLMIIRKKKESGEEQESVFEFVSAPDEKQFEELIYSQKNIKEASAGFCSPGLSKELLEKKVNLRVTEIIHPLIVFASEKTQETAITPISFKKINPTKYHLRIQNAKPLFILAFLERFDDNWQLAGFEQDHFKLNGYANGWLIDKEGNYDLILEYHPQRLFYWGSLVSGLVVLVSLFYLFR